MHGDIDQFEQAYCGAAPLLTSGGERCKAVRIARWQSPPVCWHEAICWQPSRI